MKIASLHTAANAILTLKSGEIWLHASSGAIIPLT